MKIFLTSVTLVGMLAIASSMQCEFTKFNGEHLQCRATDHVYNQRGIKFDPGHHFVNPNEIMGVAFETITVNYIPTGINEVFPNIERLVVRNASLLEILPEDIESFPNLTNIDLSQNLLRILPEKLFHNNLKLTDINLSNNQFTSIHHSVFDGLVHLKAVDLTPFVNETATSETTLLRLIVEVKTSYCQQATLRVPLETSTPAVDHSHLGSNDTALYIIIATLATLCVILLAKSLCSRRDSRYSELEHMSEPIEIRAQRANERLNRESRVDFVRGVSEVL